MKRSERDLVGLAQRDKPASEKLITLSWEDSEWFEVLQLIGKEVANHEARLASARAIMQKFVDKVDRGMAKSVLTYTEMKQWLEE